MGLQGIQLNLAELSVLGVKRVSVGSALSRAALGAFLRAAREMQEHGTFSFAGEAASYGELHVQNPTGPLSRGDAAGGEAEHQPGGPRHDHADSDQCSDQP